MIYKNYFGRSSGLFAISFLRKIKKDAATIKRSDITNTNLKINE